MIRALILSVRFGSLADVFTNSSLMSAFPESGRSDHQKLSNIKVRFRPQAAVSLSTLKRNLASDYAILRLDRGSLHGQCLEIHKGTAAP